MMIERVLNNNAAVVLDENRQEVIVMGPGIAYNKKPGGIIQSAKVEKIFTLSSRSARSKFQEIVKEIPMEYILLSEKIISQAKFILESAINDIIYIVLTDHIASAITRHKEGIDLNNPMLWDIRHFYPDEYRVGKLALEMIREDSGEELPEDEAGYIAMHFVNSQNGNKNMALAHDMTQLIRTITDIVKNYFNIEYQPESLTYFRFINHLKFFAQRMFQKVGLPDESGDLIEYVKNQNYAAYQCTLVVKDYISQNYSYNLTNEEILYMAIHISRIEREFRQNRQGNQAD